MERITEFLEKTYDLLPQPVFFAREGTIIAANQAAKLCFVLPGQPLLSVLSDTKSLADLSAEAALQLRIRLAGEDHEATITRLEDGLLFVTQRKAAENLSADILGAVSQVLRTPLSNLLGAAKTLFPQLEELENPELGQEMAALNRTAYQLLRLTFNLGDLQMLSAGQVKLAREKTELGAYFSALCDTIESCCRAAGRKFRCSLPSRVFYGWIDRQKVQRAVLNLISNSVRFTPAGGAISLSVKTAGGNVILQLSDNGEGMDAARLSSAFSGPEKTAQLWDPRCGLGFGLPYARQIAQLHDGSLVISSAPDKGTTVVISLPLAEPQAEDTRLCSPGMNFDYAGGYRHELLELADVLPLDVFDSVNVN